MEELNDVKVALRNLQKKGGMESRKETIRLIWIAENRINDLVRAKYPTLMHFMKRAPKELQYRNQGWHAWKTNGAFKSKANEWVDDVLFVAAARISEAYGMGEGKEWLSEIGELQEDNNILHPTDALAIEGHTGLRTRV